MRIALLLMWFSEKPSDLERVIRSFAPLVDSVVAVDGDYVLANKVRREVLGRPVKRRERRRLRLTQKELRRLRRDGFSEEDILEALKEPEEELEPFWLLDSPEDVNSHWDQVVTIYQTAYECGLDCTIMRPAEFWGGESKKVDYVLRLASVNADWVLCAQADYELAECDVDAVRAELASLSDDVFRVDAKEYTVPHEVEKRVSRGDTWSGNTTFTQLFVRANPFLRCEVRHWFWYYDPPNGERKIIMGDPGDESHEWFEPYKLKSNLLFNHWVLHQSHERMRLKWAYVGVKQSKFFDEHGYD